MAHDGNRIYSEVKNGVKHGIDVTADVGAVLGVASNDIGYMCSNRHGKIRPWAKYKPVEAPLPQWDVRKRYEQRMVGNVLSWVEVASGGIAGYRGATGDCGLSVTAMSTVNLAGSADAQWKYEPPHTYYRLSDFDGYYHGARAPYRGVVVTGDIVTTILESDAGKEAKVYAGQTVRFELLPSVVNKEYTLGLSDITITGMSSADAETLDKAWFGLVAYTAATCAAKDYLCFLTADTRGGSPVTWEMPSRSTGTSLWLVPVLAKNRQKYGENLVSNMIVRVPGTPIVKVTYASKEEASGIEITLTAKELTAAFGGTSGNTSVTATLVVKAIGRSYTGGGTATLKSNGVQKASHTIDEFTIAAGQTKTVLIAFGSRNWGGSLTVGVHLDGGYVKDGVVPVKVGSTIVS
jgi:hypothetical protein